MPEQQPQQPLLLDATILDMQEDYEIMKADIKLNRIEFLFPNGLNRVDLVEECRALNKINDFETMYDLTMQLLEGKSLVISLKNLDGSKSVLTNLQITDRYMDLRGDDVIDQFPVIVNWLTEFIGSYLSKKLPLPTKSQSQP